MRPSEYEKRLQNLENRLVSQSQRWPRTPAKQRQLFDTGYGDEVSIYVSGYTAGVHSTIALNCASTALGPQIDTAGLCEIIDAQTVRFELSGVYRVLTRIKYRATSPASTTVAMPLVKGGTSPTNAGSLFGSYGENTMLVDVMARTAFSASTLLIPNHTGLTESRFLAIAGGGLQSNDYNSYQEFESIVQLEKGATVSVQLGTSKSGDYAAAGLSIEFLRAAL